VTKRSTAPVERARNSSTMLGSNVKGEARKITSLDRTDRMDLKNENVVGHNCTLKMLLEREITLKSELN
jgi:hypothetical protein